MRGETARAAPGRALAPRSALLGVGKDPHLSSAPRSSMVLKHPHCQMASPAFAVQATMSSLAFPRGRERCPQPRPMALSTKELAVAEQGQPRKWRVVPLARFPC